MTVYRIKNTKAFKSRFENGKYVGSDVIDVTDDFSEEHFFSKHGNTSKVGTIYLTLQAAQNALRSINYNTFFHDPQPIIIAFSMEPQGEVQSV